MLKISFYLIEKSAQRQVDIACRLCRQISHKHRIWILCQQDQLCQQIDMALWQFEATSFIPHGIQQLQTPICISTEQPNPSFDVCINLSGTTLDLTQIHVDTLHLIHIIEQDDEHKQLGREHYKFYRQLGFTPTIHKI